MNSDKYVILVTSEHKGNQWVSNWTKLRSLERGGGVPGGSKIFNGMLWSQWNPS